MNLPREIASAAFRALSEFATQVSRLLDGERGVAAFRSTLAHVRCRLGGHVWGGWSAWQNAGRARFWRRRRCVRCHRQGVGHDG
jgi:hypothetical protein